MDEMTKKDSEQEIHNYFNLVTNTLHKLNKKKVVEFVELLLETYHNNGTIFAFGNGGSGANASHFCGDLLKGVSYYLDKRFKVMCLNDNVPVIMAIANDISFEDIFVEQLKNLVKKGDLVISFSGSGNSMNLVKAIDYANSIGVKTVAFCGYDGGRIKDMTNLAIHADVNNMEVSEDIHLILTHCVKQMLLNRLKAKG